MKLINRDADYALKALLALAGRPREATAVSELTEKLGIPRPYLRKIMQRLAREKVVLSFRGKGGGFRLARPAGDIAVADVIRTFQGRISLHDCLFKENICPDVRTCPLRKTIGRLEERLVGEFEAMSIASVLGEAQVRRGSRGELIKGGGSLGPAKKRSQP
jgi:Rrf2 family protein